MRTQEEAKCGCRVEVYPAGVGKVVKACDKHVHLLSLFTRALFDDGEQVFPTKPPSGPPKKVDEEDEEQITEPVIRASIHMDGGLNSRGGNAPPFRMVAVGTNRRALLQDLHTRLGEYLEKF